MEKLIELMNEYEPYIASDWEHRDNFWYFIYKWWSAIFPKEIWMLKIISKEYWFIKWLVENKKIDFSKVKEKIWLERELYDRMLYWYKEEDFLIMILSVEDEPIEFLVSILK